MIPNLELVAPVAFGRDNPNTTVQFLDIGHLALPKRMLKKSLSRCGISGSQLWRRRHHRSGNGSIGCWIGLRRGPQPDAERMRPMTESVSQVISAILAR